MKILQLLLLAIPFLAGCTKETYIEGLEPISKTFVLDKTIPIINGSRFKMPLDIEGEIKVFEFKISKYKTTSNTATQGINVNDSVVILSILTDMPLAIKTNTARKYSYGDQIDSTTVRSGTVQVLIAKKISPYNEPYKNVSVVGTATAYNFEINQEGYLGFIIVQDDVPIYGWIHMMIDDNVIRCYNYGYQTLKTIKAGFD